MPTTTRAQLAIIFLPQWQNSGPLGNTICILIQTARMAKKKTLAQEIRQKSDIPDRRSKGWRGGGASPPSTITLFATRSTVALCHLSGVILHQKWIQPFLSKIWCRIFFYSTFFSKKAVFSEKTAKNCFGSAFDNFLGKEGVLRRKLT